jgi:hypothetical protein
MTERAFCFVSFRGQDDGYTAYLEFDDQVTFPQDAERLLRDAARVYHRSISRMVRILRSIEKLRAARVPLPARLMWRLGDSIVELRDRLAVNSLQIDGMYEHLTRELNVRRSWLEKVVIFRTYVEREDLLPESLNWGSCARSPKKSALEIINAHHRGKA